MLGVERITHMTVKFIFILSKLEGWILGNRSLRTALPHEEMEWSGKKKHGRFVHDGRPTNSVQ